MGAVGMWGDYCEREGHGKFVEWQHKGLGTLKKVVVPIRDSFHERADESAGCGVHRRVYHGDGHRRYEGAAEGWDSLVSTGMASRSAAKAAASAGARVRARVIRGHADALCEHREDEGGAGAVLRQASAGERDGD